MIFKGNDVVWDADLNKELCKFNNGEFETNDYRLASILVKLGYEHDTEEFKAMETEQYKVLDKNELTKEVSKKPRK